MPTLPDPNSPTAPVDPSLNSAPAMSKEDLVNWAIEALRLPDLDAPVHASFNEYVYSLIEKICPSDFYDCKKNDIKFYISADATRNACAIPDLNMVVVNKGFFDSTLGKSNDLSLLTNLTQLATIIVHECKSFAHAGRRL